MIKIKSMLWLLTLVAVTGLYSCLKSNLPSLPLWHANAIENVYVEYRYNTDELFYDDPIVGYEKLLSDLDIDSASSMITLKLTVPNAHGAFTPEDRDAVSLNHLWIYMDISTGATLQAVGPTAAPGYATDLSKPQIYEVTAADGQKRKWTVKVIEFNK